MFLVATLLFVAFLLFVVFIYLCLTIGQSSPSYISGSDVFGALFVVSLFAFVLFIVAIIIFATLLVLTIELARVTGMLDLYTCVMSEPVSSFSQYWPKYSMRSMLRLCLSG